jgi:teichuronic acid biosynthesis glycosyltransferase TuaC
MRILWPHNFDHEHRVSGGLWISTQISTKALNRIGLSPHLIYLGSLRTPYGLWRARRLAARAAMAADIVHVQYGSACALICSEACARVRLVSLRGSDWAPAHSDRLVGRLHSRIAVKLTRLCLRRYDGVICMSYRMAREVQDMFPGIAAHVLPSPIDLDIFTPRDRADARRRLGLPDDGHRYVAFGSAQSHNPLKRRSLAEAAVKWVQQRLPKVSMLPIAGLPHGEMPVVLSAADAAICTSTTEGWPNFIKEALACNVPFVSTDVSDLSLIAAKEPACRVVDPTARALGQALLDVLEQPRPTGLDQHVREMGMASHAARLEEIYRTALLHKLW